MTLAVFRPIPGRASSCSRVWGISLLKLSLMALEKAIMFLALLLKRPIVFMCSFRPSIPRLSISCGVGATANRAGVILFTPLSVD